MAKVAIIRELAERLYWKLREAAQPDAVGSRAGQPEDFRGGPRSIDKMVERPASLESREGVRKTIRGLSLKIE